MTEVPFNPYVTRRSGMKLIRHLTSDEIEKIERATPSERAAIIEQIVKDARKDRSAHDRGQSLLGS